MSTTTESTDRELLTSLPVGGRVWFAEERIGYVVQARSARYLVCTKPFALQRTVIYTVIDAEQDVRGTENLIFGAGAETREQCEEMIERLEGHTDCQSEVSYRNRIPLHIRKASWTVNLPPPFTPLQR